jgi:5-methylcytosine-specific restriction endonuclease McrA
MDCDWNKVNQKTGLVPIQLEHIDGDSDNNKIENLKLLCPNCHSLTPTFGSLNKNGRDSKRKKYRKNWRNKNKFAGNA